VEIAIIATHAVSLKICRWKNFENRRYSQKWRQKKKVAVFSGTLYFARHDAIVQLSKVFKVQPYYKTLVF